MTDAKKERTPLDLYHHQWAIDERARVQHTLLGLYAYVREKSADDLEPMRVAVLDSLIGAAFALWRAVFLAADLRTKETVRKSQEDFLASVIATNTITFNDDRRNSAWSFSFYIQAAKDRLKHADHLLREGLKITPHEPIELLIQMSGYNMIGYTRYEWMCTHRALRVLLLSLYPEAKLELPGVHMAFTENDNYTDKSDGKTQEGVS
jgi:hypothetical protein